MDVFSTQPWEDYLQEMSHHGTYGDQITLHAFADMPGVEKLVISALGSEAGVWISRRSSISLCRFRRNNLLCCDEASIWYILFLRNIYQFSSFKSNNLAISFLVVMFSMLGACKFFYL